MNELNFVKAQECDIPQIAFFIKKLAEYEKFDGDIVVNDEIIKINELDNSEYYIIKPNYGTQGKYIKKIKVNPIQLAPSKNIFIFFDILIFLRIKNK